MELPLQTRGNFARIKELFAALSVDPGNMRQGWIRWPL